MPWHLKSGRHGPLVRTFIAVNKYRTIAPVLLYQSQATISTAMGTISLVGHLLSMHQQE